MKDSNWKCLGEKSSGIICPLKDMCKRNQFTMQQAHLFIAADFIGGGDDDDAKCENFLKLEKGQTTENIDKVQNNNKKKKDTK